MTAPCKHWSRVNEAAHRARTSSAESADCAARRQAKLEQGGKVVDAENLRHFCRICGCHLWAWAPEYAEYCYPVASAIDTDLPTPTER